MKTQQLIAVFGALMIASLSSEAVFANRVDRRQVKERARIHEGVESGELTKKEAAALREGQRHIRRVERRTEADGKVTPAEALRVEKAQDRQSRRIYKQKHDDQKREETTPPVEDPAPTTEPTGE